ncbi:MAG TPA: methyl-accepting chemotaxis protein [Candidatus Deferrimicrobiaceae bacterium]|jgi:methyl-accepting chemotaxis protein
MASSKYWNRLAARQMAAFALLILGVTVFLSWAAYDLARKTLVESIRERGRGLLTAFEGDAADRFAEGDKAYFSKYLQDLAWRDPSVSYAAVIDAKDTVIAHSEQELDGKKWTPPPGKGTGTMKIIERTVPWKKGVVLEFTVPVEEEGKKLGTLQLGINYTRETASLANLARKIALAGLVMLLVALLVAYKMSQRISAGLSRLSASARQIAAGDLDVQVPEDDGKIEEIRELAHAFNAMTGGLRGILDRIGQSSDRLGSFGEKVAGVIRDQAQNTTTQASSVSEITATMEELSRTSHQIARNAGDVQKTAADSVDVARKGTQLGKAGVSATDSLRNKILNISEKTSLLNEKSVEIGKVVTIIREIAGEIHLLALNAAIESAAAGENGRRFAVVASEVRRLAEKTRESTETIRSIVSEIQSAARDSSRVTGEGTVEMESWQQLVQEISSAFEEIIHRIETTSEASAQISMATNQQTSANEQVVLSMRHVAEIAQSSVRGMNGLSDATGELSQLIGGLCQEAAAFRKRADQTAQAEA